MVKIEDTKTYAESKGIIKKERETFKKATGIKMLDPDELFLDKDYVRGVIKKVIKRWENNDTPRTYVAGLKAFNLGLRWTPDKVFRNFWKQILQFINMLLMENAKAGAKDREESWVNVLEQIPSKIDSGDFDLD